MIVYKIDEWSTVVILDKYDKRRDIPDDIVTVFSDFIINSHKVFQEANYVVYIDDSEKKVMKDRGDRDYDLYVDSLLTNKTREKNLKILLHD